MEQDTGAARMQRTSGPRARGAGDTLQSVETPLQPVAARVGAQETECRVNLALEPALVTRSRVQGTPTVVLFLHGNEVARIAGPPPDVDGLLATLTGPFAA